MGFAQFEVAQNCTDVFRVRITIPESRHQNNLALFITRIKTGNRIGLIQENQQTANFSNLYCTELATTLHVSS